MDRHQRRQQQLLGVLEVVVEDVADVFRRETHPIAVYSEPCAEVATARGQHLIRSEVRRRSLIRSSSLLSWPRGLGARHRRRRPSLQMAGVSQPVEIIRDRWGINHIYAQNEPDLFFAQGYAAAQGSPVPVRDVAAPGHRHRGRDSRAARAQARHRGARLHMFRGDLDAELNHYHPRGKAIVEAYVRGVNAYIAETERNAGAAANRVQDARHQAGTLDAGGRDLAAPGTDRRT